MKESQSYAIQTPLWLIAASLQNIEWLMTALLCLGCASACLSYFATKVENLEAKRSNPPPSEI